MANFQGSSSVLIPVTILEKNPLVNLKLLVKKRFLPVEALTALSLPFGFNSTFNNLSTSVFQTLFLYVFEYFTREQQDGIGRSGNRECNVCIHIQFDCGFKKIVFELIKTYVFRYRYFSSSVPTLHVFL